MQRSFALVGATGLIVFGALTAVGCAAGAQTGGAGTPTLVAAADPSTPAAPVADPSPPALPSTPPSVNATPTPAETSAAAMWRVSSTGIGPFTLGQTWQQVANDPDPTTAYLVGDFGTCPTVFLQSDAYQFAISFAHEDASAPGPGTVMTSVDVAAFRGRGGPTPPVVGRAGVSIGSPIAAVEAAYPGGTLEDATHNPALEQTYVAEDSSVPITFGLTAGSVTEIMVGAREIPYEYCG